MMLTKGGWYTTKHLYCHIIFGCCFTLNGPLCTLLPTFFSPSCAKLFIGLHIEYFIQALPPILPSDARVLKKGAGARSLVSEMVLTCPV